MDSREFKERRKALGLSISTGSRELGVSRATLCRWESNKNPPKIAVKALCFIGIQRSTKSP